MLPFSKLFFFHVHGLSLCAFLETFLNSKLLYYIIFVSLGFELVSQATYFYLFYLNKIIGILQMMGGCLEVSYS